MHPQFSDCYGALTGGTVGSPPEPHPLDFDWRFNPTTIRKLSELLPRDTPLLAIGAPSIARQFVREGREVALVDRQPLQCVEKHYPVDIDAGGLGPSGYGTALVDPPWYPEHFKTWTAWAANCVGPGGTIFASTWPDHTRPNATSEHEELFTWMSEWSNVSDLKFTPVYEIPIFEKIARQFDYQPNLSRSPLIGRLLKIHVHSSPRIPSITSKKDKWLRFVLDDYQLAVRMRPDQENTPTISPLSDAGNWCWPYVSRRAPLRSQIDIWSSRNEAGSAKGLEAIANALHTAFTTNNGADFDAALSNFPALLEWQLPRPPYRRMITWSHQQ